jgi:thiol-disulfide isomerase/thioredoxin
MIKPLIAAITAILFAVISPLFPSVSFAADDGRPVPAAGDAKTELDALVQKVQTKIDAGKKSEADFKDELKQFDAILVEHKGEKTDEVAQVLLVKAQLYTDLFDNDAKALELIKRLKTDFPDTRLGMNADRITAMILEDEATEKARLALIGTVFPDFNEKDIDGKPLSVANYKGKVVLVDFWATWCGPCVEEMPNVIKVYEKYHGKGFEIIGISLDQDKDSLVNFIKQNNMTWREYFDGQGFDNKLAVKYGVQAIPSNFLIGRNGKIIDTELSGQALDDAVAKALKQ